MIESITIKNVATYDKVGVQINGLKKVNFIYGANASGKTTISNFLVQPELFADCSVTWKNAQELKVLAYNKDFRDKNFGKGKIAGIFTLGEATKEQKQIVEEKMLNLKEKKADVIKKKETLEGQDGKGGLKGGKQELIDKFKETSWTKIYKKYENGFKEAFRGSLQKESFRDKLLQEFESNKTELKTLDELKEKAKTIFGEQPQRIDSISLMIYEQILEINNNSIWKKIIIGKADVNIAKLIQKLNINDWVNQGRIYLQEEDNICPFCQKQTITDEFRKQLDSFFDETYISDIKLLKELKQEYNSLTQNLINELNIIETNQKNLKNSKLDMDKYSAYLKTLISQNMANVELLNNKEKEPSRSIELVSLEEQLNLIAKLITDANTKIQKHNDIVNNFNAEKSILISSVWKFLCDSFKDDITKFLTDKNGMEKGIVNLESQLKAMREEYAKLDNEIKELSKHVTSMQPTIDEINRLLKSYGFLNFEIVPASEDGFYQIQREDGTIAERTLSEGEITFITFLYYLQLTKGGVSEETVNEERILIIDDPISSLDSNVLFVVSTLIKEVIKNIKADNGHIRQLILLTHNIYFHKEVSYEELNRKGEKSQFWILRKNLKQSTIQFYGESNPIQSSYELLWREIKEWEKNSGITIQNTMRRILENFFSILGTKRDKFLINKFDNQEEREICRSLLSWINEGSHTLNDDLFVEAPDGIIEKYLIVFRGIFTHTENSGHYNMMMGIDDNFKRE
jgi:wobble nucleotide-excising tRNase